MPNRILYYAKIVKGERNDKAEKPCFYSFGTAEPHPILCKDVANEWNESCFHIPECSYILCKDVANERNESLLSYSRVQLHLMQMYEKKLTIKQNSSQFYPEPVI